MCAGARLQNHLWSGWCHHHPHGVGTCVVLFGLIHLGGQRSDSEAAVLCILPSPQWWMGRQMMDRLLRAMCVYPSRSHKLSLNDSLYRSSPCREQEMEKDMSCTTRRYAAVLGINVAWVLRGFDGKHKLKKLRATAQENGLCEVNVQKRWMYLIGCNIWPMIILALLKPLKSSVNHLVFPVFLFRF